MPCETVAQHTRTHTKYIFATVVAHPIVPPRPAIPIWPQIPSADRGSVDTNFSIPYFAGNDIPPRILDSMVTKLDKNKVLAAANSATVATVKKYKHIVTIS